MMHGDLGFDFGEFMRRVLKYFIEGFFVALSAFYIPQGKRLKMEEVFTIGLTAAAIFALLDMYAPAIAPAARVGGGFGIGAKLVGFPK